MSDIITNNKTCAKIDKEEEKKRRTANFKRRRIYLPDRLGDSS